MNIDDLNLTYFQAPRMRGSSLPARVVRLFCRLLQCYATDWSPPDFVYTPHNKSFVEAQDFRAGYVAAVNHIGNDYRIPWRCHQAIWAARHCLKICGDFVELGTGKGFVMQAVLGAIGNWDRLGKHLYLYDVFEKFSVTGLGKEIHNRYYADDLASVKEYFRGWQNVIFVPGNVNDTIAVTCPNAISFLHVDLNNADSEVRLLRKLWPLVSSGGVVILDDYANRGEEYAYSEHNRFFSAEGAAILTTPSGQGIVLK